MIVFAYNFPHLKTQIGLFNLFYYGYKPHVILAPFTRLNHYRSKIRIVPKHLDLLEPRSICGKLGFSFTICPHNESEEICKANDGEIGIILGARILKKEIINCFTLGIINAHCGVLPENRGLDNIKWAILLNLPQGVTTHYINELIDHGRIIDKKIINVYEDDTLTDIYLRLLFAEQEMLIHSIGKEGKPMAQRGYRNSVPMETEEKLMRYFPHYKKVYGEICENYFLYYK